MEGEYGGEGIGSSSGLNLGWRDPESLGLLCRVAREAGFLGDVEVLPLATDPTCREFLLTVDVADGIVLASAKLRWSELEPPAGVTGIEAVQHVLGRIDEIARRTEAGLNGYTWLRVASELEQVRALIGDGQDG
ncbi:hypothetical protein ACWD5R_08905 [Streptomyces sp. NPDC002514]|uniref:hypothetical protein n=1 Tax=Streptomyces sp. NPDC001270 TaxID=3364554 RepID=UPI003692410B